MRSQREPMDQILVRLPWRVIAAIDEITPERGRNEYIRQAVALKLAMDLRAAQDGDRDIDADVRRLIAHVLRYELQPRQPNQPGDQSQP
jgi:hypothetical protein